jgi:hypothetical protein
LLGRPALDRGYRVDMTPFPRNIGFLGRDAEIAEMQKFLEKDGRAFVTGIGGMPVGKTQLLLEYVYRDNL